MTRLDHDVALIHKLQQSLDKENDDAHFVILEAKHEVDLGRHLKIEIEIKYVDHIIVSSHLNTSAKLFKSNEKMKGRTNI